SGSELEFNSVNNNPQLARNPALANEMVKLTNESTVKGNMDALLVTTGLIVLGILAAMNLPKVTNVDRAHSGEVAVH
ncbi:MAG TPA: hypothetical protein VHA74_03370, partial [Candidatus Dojkabacteria bacterium]|nr:hypothetical protein [Candidatus Dojkabacteria bacterium]